MMDERDILEYSKTVIPVVDVEPLRVVPHGLCLEGHARHEAEGLVEVLEGEGLGDGVPEQGIGIS